MEPPEAPFLPAPVRPARIGLDGAGDLSEGEVARLSATGGRRVTATEPAEVLVWEMHATIAT